MVSFPNRSLSWKLLVLSGVWRFSLGYKPAQIVMAVRRARVDRLGLTGALVSFPLQLPPQQNI